MERTDLKMTKHEKNIYEAVIVVLTGKYAGRRIGCASLSDAGFVYTSLRDQYPDDEIRMLEE